MSQCVPSWDVDENPQPPRSVSLRSNSNSTAPDVHMLDYDVAELTWKNGQISMHGLGLPRVPVQASTNAATTNSNKETWEKPRASGTLESVVNQATSFPNNGKPPFLVAGGVVGNMLVPWLDAQRVAAIAAATNGMAFDALVPGSNLPKEHKTRATDPIPRGGRGIGSSMVGGMTHVGSCSGIVAATQEEGELLPTTTAKRGRVTHVPRSAMDQQSMSGSATFGMKSQQVTLDTYDREFGTGGFTSTSIASLDSTSSDKQFTRTTTIDDHDSVCHTRPTKEDDDDEEKKRENGKSSISTKRSRAAAIHNQSERKRRDKINQRMKTLQKLVPNSSKTDKASMLDEVIEYLKQLQAQVQMVNRFNMSSMMMPMTIQQQLQMSMMNQMGMGMGMGMPGMGMGMSMGMGMGMDMNTMNRASIPGMPSVLHPSAFMPMPTWDAIAGGGDRLPGPPAAAGMTDPLSTFFGCQSQPMTMDAYSRIAAMYQQMQQAPPPGSKS